MTALRQQHRQHSGLKVARVPQVRRRHVIGRDVLDGVDGYHATDPPRIELLLDQLIKWLVAQDVADHDNAIVLPRDAHQIAHLMLRRRDRLLQQDVIPSAQKGNRRGVMHDVERRVDHRIRQPRPRRQILMRSKTVRRGNVVRVS